MAAAEHAGGAAALRGRHGVRELPQFQLSGRAAARAPAWNALFWIILLFAALGAAGRGLAQESAGLRLYYYTVARPEAVVLAKILYNALLLLALAVPGLLLYTLLLGNPVQDWPLYALSIGLGAVSLASSLTLVAGIAARAGQGEAARCWPYWACRCWCRCCCCW
ncbi:MAG: hypothetical protein WKG07_06335 [Hymenobacter sp.]